ncbi:transposase [Psychrosphaera sp. 1_MG-2023]|uniref:transposase n=1 Tax=Psychrosphaera sp. 1_MG-2023 TaxID=3062643 RepID=UPI0026E43529|nr:transposase [Psychrosphaera sp. 1_MG-2023]MDO6721159.1 transposase [Psychrosphaera sp. 1_MG-2023]
MALARHKQVSIIATPYYHCISRCVRRAYLCGVDKTTGVNYEHRRIWVEKRLLELPKIFAIEVCAYAVMHNHTHSLLHVKTDQAESWTTLEVLWRWHQIFKGTVLTRKYAKDGAQSLTKTEQEAVIATAEVYRGRLSCISWFMRVLNEGIARKANREDNCTGRFWEGRFKSQALLDNSAILACMVYIDLNPLRAGVCKTLGDSKYTSIFHKLNAASTGKTFSKLKIFSKNDSSDFTLDTIAYIDLVQNTADCFIDKLNDKTARAIHENSLLGQLGFENTKWLELTNSFEEFFRGPVGCESSITKYAKLQNHKRRPNLTQAKYFMNEQKPLDAHLNIA